MKLGVISDVHGDPAALELTCARLEMLGASRVLCAGDVVGYGPNPDGVVAILRETAIPVARGNHDRWALERRPGQGDPFGGAPPGAEALEFLRALPHELIVDEGGRRVLVTHGSPGDDMDFVTRRTHPPEVLRGFLDLVGADVLIVGHTHQPMWYRCERGLVVNPGSLVTLPVVKTSRSFAVIDLETMSVTFHGVESGRVLVVRPWEDEGESP